MSKAYKCSNCGEVLVLDESLFRRQFKVFCPKCKKMATFNIKELKYCPQCGRKLKEADDGND